MIKKIALIVYILVVEMLTIAVAPMTLAHEDASGSSQTISHEYKE